MIFNCYGLKQNKGFPSLLQKKIVTFLILYFLDFLPEENFFKKMLQLFG